MPLTTPSVPPDEATWNEAKARQAARASFLGSMLEYYDFYVYGSAAALIFNEVFFTRAHGAIGTLASLATFGVGYVARPVGGVVLGHFGDRVGRKKVMLFTLVLMGASTFLIGCLPSYSSIGILAPVLLVLLRLAQGFSAGGEQAGANSLTLEHAPPNRRAFYTSWTLTGTQAGFILASLMFLVVSTLPDRQLFAWGWRIPFWSSAVVVVVAYWVRRRLEEPREFTEKKDHDRTARLPGVAVLRSQPWDVLRVALCQFNSVGGSIFSVFALAYATGDDVGLSRTTMLWVAIFANVCALVMQPLAALLADQIGRKPVFIGGALGFAATMFLYLHALSTANLGYIFFGAFLVTSCFYSCLNATWPSMYGEWFSTPVRYSGTAIGTQVGIGFAGFAPTIAYAILGDGPGGWIPVALLVAFAMAVAATSCATGRETYRTPMSELGKQPVPTAAPTPPQPQRPTVTR
ncbi:MFS transporter [Streptomyces botrytidirepellens]|uniref:Putative proline/betaine transporter n=1 Tax=Streptomyces botrytidirepellens TaxID=2486417 RepID=A0A3M8WS73_9ACTN|nr:MFS transporter [Streptomyces botrytidirepellens]RNG31899.1 MFS transporter [Streptomyces botrytidirepellens]